MLTPERITQLPEASEIGESDYILLDSPTLGTRKFLASKLEPSDPHIYLGCTTGKNSVNPANENNSLDGKIDGLLHGIYLE